MKYKPTIPSSTEFNKKRVARAQLLGLRRLLTAVTLLAVITCLFSLCQKPLSNMMLKGNSCASHRKMTVSLLVVLVASACLVDGCPPWFEWVNTSDTSCGYCACPRDVPYYIHCDERKQISSISQASCIFYNSEEDIITVAGCSFFLPDRVTKNGMFALPSNVSKLNSVMCGNLSRKVKTPLCGRCTNGTGPSIYSIGIKCVPCNLVHILYYLMLQYLPSTVIFILVMIFRPNVTSAPMAGYVLFCNTCVLYCRLNLWLFAKPSSVVTYLGKTALTLSAIWSFDALLFISPHLCISPHIEEYYIPFFEFLATLFPFILLSLTYTVIELYNKNFRLAICLWRLFRRVYVKFYRAWDPRSSLIHAFASLFFLSYAKLSYVIWETFIWSEGVNNKGKTDIKILYIDPNVPYYSTKHGVLMAFSVAVAVFIYFPPLLILVVYPTSLYRKISHCISPKWRLRIKIYVDIFNGCLKDGTNGTRDYRSLSGWAPLLFSFFPTLLVRIVATINSQHIFISSYIVASFLCIVAFSCICLQPYKDKHSNNLTAGLLVLFSLLGISVIGIESQQRENAEVFMAILILVPHSVFLGYIVWRVIKCCRCQTQANTETQQFLHSYSETPKYSAINKTASTE